MENQNKREQWQRGPPSPAEGSMIIAAIVFCVCVRVCVCVCASAAWVMHKGGGGRACVLCGERCALRCV